MKTFNLIVAALASVLAASVPAFGDVAIVDGDTFDLDGVRIRLNGIDAPEYGQTCGSWDCGAAALDTLEHLIRSGPVECQPLGKDGHFGTSWPSEGVYIIKTLAPSPTTASLTRSGRQQTFFATKPRRGYHSIA